MRTEIHILNGDALKEQFPGSIEGTLIVARECLVDGDVQGDTMDEFYNTRADFLSKNYGGTRDMYFEQSVTEFQKILNIKDDADINLWFEDDLFCQVNFWFVISLIVRNNKKNKVFLVRPPSLSKYGFGGLDAPALTSIYKNKLTLNHLHDIAGLWAAYRKNDTSTLIDIALKLNDPYPFILNAVEAHIARIPTADNPGKPVQILKDIMRELDTEEFGPVFREINKRAYIYGFGDLQVKRLYDQIVNQ